MPHALHRPTTSYDNNQSIREVKCTNLIFKLMLSNNKCYTWSMKNKSCRTVLCHFPMPFHPLVLIFFVSLFFIKMTTYM